MLRSVERLGSHFSLLQKLNAATTRWQPIQTLVDSVLSSTESTSSTPKTTRNSKDHLSNMQSKVVVHPETQLNNTRSLTATASVGQKAAQQPNDGATTPATVRAPNAAAASEPLSMKAAVIFETCWNRMVQRLGDYVCPREIVWLNGAPGSGKGTNIPFIMRTRGMTRAVTMSQLLDGSPGIKSMIDKGELVPDTMVLDALLDAVLNPDRNDGAGLVIDGFPRTAMQVDFVKLLYDKLMSLHLRHADSPDEFRFPRPSFKVVILYVDEDESVRRQLNRARLAQLHNQRVMEAGTGEMWDVRTTDVSESLCKRRYQVFKAHYHTILRLKQFFAFSLIDAMGSMEECRSQIVRELRYQSSLDLDEKTYQAIRHLPLARDLVRVARQRLVFRLDNYCRRHTKIFNDVVKLIDTDLIPVLKKCSLAGHAEFKTRHPLLIEHPVAVDMLVDVLSDRGFSVAVSREERYVPLKIDLATGVIENREEVINKLRITFDKENVRDLSTSSTKAGGDDIAIGTTTVPDHMRRESKSRLALEPGSAAKAVSRDYSDKGNVKLPFSETAQAMHLAAAIGNEDGKKKINGSDASSKKKGNKDANKEEVSAEDLALFDGYAYDSMDHELSVRQGDRYYGFQLMNDRED